MPRLPELDGAAGNHLLALKSFPDVVPSTTSTFFAALYVSASPYSEILAWTGQIASQPCSWLSRSSRLTLALNHFLHGLHRSSNAGLKNVSLASQHRSVPLLSQSDDIVHPAHW